MNGKTPDLTICIVTFNTKEMLSDCIDSIYKAAPKAKYDIVVVDNNSQDNTVSFLKQNYPNVRLIENDKNTGFAYANNQAIKAAESKYCLLLNSDTVVGPNSIDELLCFMESHPDTAVAAPKLLNRDGSLQPNCKIFLDLKTAFFLDTILGLVFPGIERKYRMSEFNYDRTLEIDQPMGAAVIVRMDAIRQVGLLDERFFFFFEEVDWFYRMKQEGWKIYFVHNAEVFHYKKDDSMVTGRLGQLRIFNWHKGKYKFLSKNYSCVLVILLKIFVIKSSLLFIIKNTLNFKNRDPYSVKLYWTLIKASL
ncbi:MAG: glycosyltransferase family 2 protein [Elusimicrobia bacterium]|nr:glycosyltransferase family 2 protein [Elusimicrobiota bacterium]